MSVGYRRDGSQAAVEARLTLARPQLREPMNTGWHVFEAVSYSSAGVQARQMPTGKLAGDAWIVKESECQKAIIRR